INQRAQLRSEGMCKSFRNHMREALRDGYSSMQDALRAAYAKTDGLPKGVSDFNVIMHYQILEYDLFGNVTHTVSPLSHNREWIERRFSYDADPIRRKATSTDLTRCVNDIAGAGIDSPDVQKIKVPRCTFGLGPARRKSMTHTWHTRIDTGLERLPEPVQRKAITHTSHTRIDTHFGVIAESRDLNANSVLYDFDRWGRLSLIARSWGNAPRENKTFESLVDLAVRKADRLTYTPEAKVKDWRILAVADYAGSGGLQRSNLRRFESSDSYAGLLSGDNTTRETAIFSDGLGRPIQNIREADVCLDSSSSLMAGRTNVPPSAGLAQRCTQVATGIAMPSPSVDALGRELESFESYS